MLILSDREIGAYDAGIAKMVGSLQPGETLSIKIKLERRSDLIVGEPITKIAKDQGVTVRSENYYDVMDMESYHVWHMTRPHKPTIHFS